MTTQIDRSDQLVSTPPYLVGEHKFNEGHVLYGESNIRMPAPLRRAQHVMGTDHDSRHATNLIDQDWSFNTEWMLHLDKPTDTWFYCLIPRIGHEIVALDVVLMHSIYHAEIGAMLDAMGFCMRCFTVGTGTRG